MEAVCPSCHGRLDAQGTNLLCSECGEEYEVAGGIPILLSTLSAQHEHQRRYFDAEFAAVSEYRLDSWRQSFNERLFPALQLLQMGGPYLDIGVGGSGGTVIEAARLGVRSTGCDLSVEGVTSASRHARGQHVDGLTSFVVCAAESLPFPDRSFTAASAIAVLEHLDDDEVAIRELARVVSPGGRVWVTVPHAYRMMPPFLWLPYWLHDRRIGHKRHYGRARLQHVFQRHGFELVESQFTGHPVKLLQYALTLAAPARRDVSRLWWRLERIDLRAVTRPFWALQLSAVFERQPDA